MTDQLARFFSNVDHVNHVALVALPKPDSTAIVGVARFIRYSRTPEEADLAITVADQWQGLGVVTELLVLLARRARAVGIHRFTVDMLADNAAVLALVRAAGGEDQSPMGGIVAGHIDLERTIVPLSETTLLRTVVSVSGLPVPHPLPQLVPELRPAARAVVDLDH